MEKFAIDLDKVLDDFEINEDRAERLAAGKGVKQPNYTTTAAPCDEHLDSSFQDAKYNNDEFLSHMGVKMAVDTAPDCSSVQDAGSICVQTCEDKEPDLLGTIRSQQNQLQEHERREFGAQECEGSLPDVTVPSSRPSHSRTLEMQPSIHTTQSLEKTTIENDPTNITDPATLLFLHQMRQGKGLEIASSSFGLEIHSQSSFNYNQLHLNTESLEVSQHKHLDIAPQSMQFNTTEDMVNNKINEVDCQYQASAGQELVLDRSIRINPTDSSLNTHNMVQPENLAAIPTSENHKSFCDLQPVNSDHLSNSSSAPVSSEHPVTSSIGNANDTKQEAAKTEERNVINESPQEIARQDENPIPIKPVGFSNAQDLSDAELERMLNELEEEEDLGLNPQNASSPPQLCVLSTTHPDSKNQEVTSINCVSTCVQSFEDSVCLTSSQACSDDHCQLAAPASSHPNTESMPSGSSHPDKIEPSIHDNQQFDLNRTLEKSINDGITVNEEIIDMTTDTQISVPEEACRQEQQVMTPESQENHPEADEDGKPHRPSSLQLSNEDDDSIPYPPGSTVTVGPPGNTPGSNVPAVSGMSYTIPPEEPMTPSESYEASPSVSSSSSSSGAEEATALEDQQVQPLSLLQSLGVMPPYWVPDSEAPMCMHCEAKFTVIKRRHHCRACGKVLCSRCCSQKARLQYLENAEARVCQSCHPILCAAEEDDSGSNSNSPQRLSRSPNPNNPMEYCSTIPPLQQAVGSRNQRPPSVMVPVGVLKREGSSRNRGEPKQVMFSDGIRPGGDLTDLDGWVEPRSSRNKGRQTRRVGTPPGPLLSPATTASTSTVQGLRVPEVPECRPRSVEQRTQSNVLGTTGGMALVPSDLASYTLLADSRPGAFSFDLSADTSNLMDTLRKEDEPPVVFALNRNLFVLVKIVTLSCCVHKTVWCFTTRGLRCEGQDEMVFILEALPEEKCVPRDVFAHISAVYVEAGKGNNVTDLGHTTFHGPFLGSNDHGGFLYIRPTSQCLQRLVLPPPPYLVAILLQRWEAPWARLFPLRLLLRLGYEFRYYPCPLVSVRERRPVYCEVGQTILDILADFRNFTYTLPCIQGLTIHMEDRQTSLLIPRNRYDQVVRVLNNSNDHVLALGGSFSRDADCHLVCVQADDETYHSKAISILNRPRKVTGASFLVFNGALKTSSGLSAKSSIVEDGLMVQVPPDMMQALRAALRDMKNFSVGCGPASVHPPAETVVVTWVDDDRYFNVGVRSQIDGCKLDGIPSIRVHSGTDYRGENCFIRWTEVFLWKCEEGGVANVRTGTDLDISRVSESIARAFCVALVPLLDLLATAGLLILAIRATLDPDNVGYEAGSNGEKLPPLYMRSLDDELVPVIHQAASQAGEGKTVLELVFSVMRH